MAIRTHYVILGVSKTESPSRIRAAYRKLAKQFHPDVAGEQATETFREINEAYGVLSDEARRRAYNQQIGQAEAADATVRGTEVMESMSLLAEREAISPSFDAMFERFLRNFTGIDVPKSERLEALSFEVLLTPEEAVRGCDVPVCIPVFRRCPACGGSGRDWVFPCLVCQEQGVLEREREVRIHVPAMVPSGSVFEIPLDGLEIHNFYLRLHVFIQPDAVSTLDD